MGNNKITERRAIFQRERQNSSINKQTKSVNNRKTGKKTQPISGAWVAQLGSWITQQLIQTYHQYAWVCVRLWKLQKGYTRLAAASVNAYQFLAHGRWFSPGASTTKTDRNDITEILLRVALSTINQIKSNKTIFATEDFHTVGGEIGRKKYLLFGQKWQKFETEEIRYLCSSPQKYHGGNGQLQPVIWPTNTRGYVFFIPGFLTNQNLL